MGRQPKDSTTAQVETWHLWTTSPGTSPHRPEEKDPAGNAATAGLGGWGRDPTARFHPSLGGEAGLPGSSAVIGPLPHRKSRLAPFRPLRFKLHVCRFARALRGHVFISFCRGLASFSTRLNSAPLVGEHCARPVFPSFLVCNPSPKNGLVRFPGKEDGVLRESR